MVKRLPSNWIIPGAGKCILTSLHSLHSHTLHCIDVIMMCISCIVDFDFWVVLCSVLDFLLLCKYYEDIIFLPIYLLPIGDLHCHGKIYASACSRNRHVSFRPHLIFSGVTFDITLLILPDISNILWKCQIFLQKIRRQFSCCGCEWHVSYWSDFLNISPTE